MGRTLRVALALGAALLASCSSPGGSPERIAYAIVDAGVIDDTRIRYGAGCALQNEELLVVGADDATIRVRVEADEPEQEAQLACLSVATVDLGLDEPIGGRHIVDDVTGDVVADGRARDGMPLLGNLDRIWEVQEAQLRPPALAEIPPAPAAWYVEYTWASGANLVVVSGYPLAGIELVDHLRSIGGAVDTVETNDGIRYEVELDDGGSTSASMLWETAPGWSVLVLSSDLGIDGVRAFAASVERLDPDEWRHHVGLPLDG